MCRGILRHYGIQSFCRVLGALGNSPKTLGNCFAECNTRHTTHDIFLSANSYLPSVFCRALGKAFAECRKSTRQRFTLGKMKMRKKPKNNSKIFFSGKAATSQRPPVFIEVGAFFALNSRLTRPAGFELMTSPSRVCCSTTALHRHLCLDFVIYLHILY